MALVMPPVDPTVLARRGAIVAALELFFRPIASWRTRWCRCLSSKPRPIRNAGELCGLEVALVGLPLTGDRQNTWGRSSGDRDWGGVVCCCSADVVPETAVQVGDAHVHQ